MEDQRRVRNRRSESQEASRTRRVAARGVEEVHMPRTAAEREVQSSDLAVRTQTGFIYVALAIILTLASGPSMVILLCVLAGISSGELFYMLRSDAKMPNAVLGIVAAVLYPVVVWLWGMEGAMALTLVFLFALLCWYVFSLKVRISDVGISLFGALYCGMMLSSFIPVRYALGGFWGGLLVVLIFAGVWLNDAMAYLVGSRFGRHKMAPKISPKKSWEGFAAGLFASVVVWCFMTLVPGVTMGIPKAILFGILCGLAGVLGDLAESRIKRNTGVKDSGNIMPGHGGLLDRNDSMFAVAVVSAVLLLGTGCLG